MSGRCLAEFNHRVPPPKSATLTARQTLRLIRSLKGSEDRKGRCGNQVVDTFRKQWNETNR